MGELKNLDQIKSFLLDQPCGRISPSGRELNMRCPHCGDSRKSSTSTNFSINIDPDSDRFLMYQCFRVECLTKGRVDQDFLNMLGFNNYEVIKDLNAYHRKQSKKGNRDFKSKYQKELTNIINPTSELSEAKLAYINSRLGLNLTFEDLFKLKINLSFTDLLKFNQIQIPDKKTYYYKKLSDYGISFISAYNDYVIIRDVSKSNKLKKRYTNINIFDNYDNVTKFYTIPSRIDILDPEPIVLNVAEGAFDIIGVYYNTNIDRDYKQHIYSAACGGGINNLITHMIKQYGLINLKINIFSDSDAKKSNYESLHKIKPLLTNFDVTVYYNTLEKDFGVSKKNIKYISSKL